MTLTQHSALSTQHSRKAFTLIELIVAVAILLGIMVMIGMVFQTAGKSSGKAQAMAVVHRHLRQSVEQIRSDLAGMTPGTGLNAPVMAIAGVEVKAHATPEDKSTGRPLANTDTHRADVLMLFTNRKTSPYIFRDPNYNNPATAIKFGDTVQVVYGHADLGMLTNQSGTWQFGTNPGQTRRVEGAAATTVTSSVGTSDIAASEWHLARRLVSFPAAAPVPPSSFPPSPNPAGVWPQTGTATLGDPKFLDGEADVYRDPAADLWGILLDNTPSFFGQGYHHYTAAGVNPNYYILKGANGLWYRYDTANATTGPWYLFNAPPASDYRWRYRQNLNVWQNESPPVDTNSAGVVSNPGGYLLPDARPWFYDTTQTDRRTLLDLNPPVGAPERMSAYFLPACTDFRVEYTYDDPREILIAPDTPTSTNYTAQPTLPIRWQTVPHGQQMVWSRLSVSSNMYAGDPSGFGREYTDPLRWPRALRITLRVTGQGTSLEQPVEQAIIYAWDE